MQQMIKKPLISIAPMLDVTNTHFRYMSRLLSSESILYTQMLHHNAIINNPDRLLHYNQIQHPVVLQLGGSNPKLLAQAAILAKKYAYDQINLNVGCPSPRVQQGSFGACLMKDKLLVSECMKAMKMAVEGIDCTVKCRLGVDQFDSYEFVKNFIEEVSLKGQVKHFIIHARKAFLKGLNPAQNRNIPPLKYDMVYQLIEDFPDLKFTINGGIKTLGEAEKLLNNHPMLHGCMIGRTAYQNPYEMAMTDQIIYKQYNKPVISRYEVLEKYADYVKQVEQKQPYINGSVLVKPIINLFNGKRHSSKYRHILSDNKRMKKDSIYEIINDAKEYMVNNLKQQNEEMIPHQQQIVQNVIN